MDLKLSYVFLIGGFWSCFAQNDSIQNPYFKTYDDKITTSLFFLDTSNSFETIFTTQGEKKYLKLIPNKKEQIGFHLNYKFIDISYGFSPQFFNENKDNGESKLFSIGTRLMHKKWMQSVTFINQKGFYARESGFQAFFPKLRSTKIGGTTSYIFNENFSYKAIVNQKDWQTKSAGSFIPNFSFYYTNLDLNDGNENNHSDIYVYSIAPSYFYNWVINNTFLASAGLAVGAGINSIDKKVAAVYEWDASVKLAYNTESFFVNAHFNYNDFIQNATTQIRLNDNISTVKFGVGYRWNTPKKIAELYQKTSKKIHLTN